MATKDTGSEAPKDPITSRSLLWPILTSTVLLLLTTGWALYDEAVTRRPWKEFQRDWVRIAPEAYGDKMRAARRDEARIRESERYQELTADIREAREAAEETLQALNDELNKKILPALAAISEPAKIARSEVSAARYRAEVAETPREKKRTRARLRELKTRKREINWFGETVYWDYERLLTLFQDLKARQAALQGEMADAQTAERKAIEARKTFMEDSRRTPAPAALRKLIDAAGQHEIEIKQIHVELGGGRITDRCESCHAGIRSPVALTPPDVQGRREFISHPTPELLDIHDPATFGCTPCHNGNGVAVDSVKKAHGRYKHWLWPMHEMENVEAGCVQCHTQDMVLGEGRPFGDLYDKGRHLFRWIGCVGCHKWQGYDRELDNLKDLEKEIEVVEEEIKDIGLELQAVSRMRDNVPEFDDPDRLDRYFMDLERREEKAVQDRFLLQKERERLLDARIEAELEVKKVGPNLKEIADKLRPEWIQPWLMDPRGFRPDTKMPRFRLSDREAWDIAAFLWQSAVPRDDVPDYEEGDPREGELLLKQRGCMGCHKVPVYNELEGWVEVMGDGFAATLDRLGEKADFDYLVSWIQDPRKHNKYTVMPTLRITEEEARHMAAYLVSLRAEDAGGRYPERDQALEMLRDESRFSRGEELVKYFGCAGCHEIRGLEAEGRVGTELTKEGSKPIERLDFGLYTKEAKRNGWYDHKGFFSRKLRDPSFWDDGKILKDTFERLRMPGFWPRPGQEVREEAAAEDAEQRRALVTFLLGSVDSNLPEPLMNRPSGRRKHIQEGWWLIRKYNCDGCHQVVPGVKPDLWSLPWYTLDGDLEGVPKQNGRPPTLVGEGTRVDPGWLSRFLANPALTDDPEAWHRNGVRQGLMIRMPTYEFSENERAKLVAFFQALSGELTDYVAPDMDPLEGRDLLAARAAFVSGDCYNCHLLGGESSINPSNTYAPSFVPVAERIRHDWLYRWVTRPASVIPGTAMPELLKRQPAGDGVLWRMELTPQGRERLTQEELEAFRSYQGDHARLLQRYFATWTQEEAEVLKRKRAGKK